MVAIEGTTLGIENHVFLPPCDTPPPPGTTVPCPFPKQLGRRCGACFATGRQEIARCLLPSAGDCRSRFQGSAVACVVLLIVQREQGKQNASAFVTRPAIKETFFDALPRTFFVSGAAHFEELYASPKPQDILAVDACYDRGAPLFFLILPLILGAYDVSQTLIWRK